MSSIPDSHSGDYSSDDESLAVPSGLHQVTTVESRTAQPTASHTRFSENQQPASAQSHLPIDTGTVPEKDPPPPYSETPTNTLQGHPQANSPPSSVDNFEDDERRTGIDHLLASQGLAPAMLSGRCADCQRLAIENHSRVSSAVPAPSEAEPANRADRHGRRSSLWSRLSSRARRRQRRSSRANNPAISNDTDSSSLSNAYGSETAMPLRRLGRFLDRLCRRRRAHPEESPL